MPNTIEKVISRLVIQKPDALPSPCWDWPGHRCTGGYGVVSIQGKIKMVHRAVYEHFRGPVPQGYELHHHCRNRICANPDHLDVLTRDQHRAIPAQPYVEKPRIEPVRKKICPHGSPRVIDCRPCMREYHRDQARIRRAAQTVHLCKKGHTLTFDGTTVDGKPHRYCSICLTAASKKPRKPRTPVVRKAPEKRAANQDRKERREQQAAERAARKAQIQANRIAAAQARKEKRANDPCPQGHPRTPENVYVSPQGHRQCRVCREAQLVKQRQKPADASKRPHKLKTHCVHGHPLAGDNLYVSPKGQRFCRECQRIKDKRRKH